MTNKADVEKRMPALLLHEGVWEGDIKTVDADGSITDRYRARVQCIFPDGGPYAYVQKNRFTWDDGRSAELEFGGVLRGDRIYWDTDRFAGYAWQSGDDIIVLTLDRKDLPDTSFTEIIMLAPGGRHRARTWHWFRDGRLFQRTLCDESRVTD